MTNIPNGPLIKPSKKDCNDIIISIDGNKTFLRDDGLSVRKDGNKYIVGIHVADAAAAIEKIVNLI